MVPQALDTDILILGSGGAGLFAALHAHKAAPELAITVAVKGLLGKCGCTRMVQGGYNVALAKEDSVERHFMDTIEGGKWLPRQDLAWRLVEGAIEPQSAPARVFSDPVSKRPVPLGSSTNMNGTRNAGVVYFQHCSVVL